MSEEKFKFEIVSPFHRGECLECGCSIPHDNPIAYCVKCQLKLEERSTLARHWKSWEDDPPPKGELYLFWTKLKEDWPIEDGGIRVLY